MKMTLHIDAALLKRVMKNYECESKTAAIAFALAELDRRTKLKRFAREGLGLTPEELGTAFDPSYNLMALREAEKPLNHDQRCPRR